MHLVSGLFFFTWFKVCRKSEAAPVFGLQIHQLDCHSNPRPVPKQTLILQSMYSEKIVYGKSAPIMTRTLSLPSVHLTLTHFGYCPVAKKTKNLIKDFYQCFKLDVT